MVVEADIAVLVIEHIDRLSVCSVPTLGLTPALPALFLLLEKNVEDLLGVHATILLIEETLTLTCCFRTGKRYELLFRIHVVQLDVDDEVTRRIRDVAVDVIQRLPYSHVSVALVHVLVHDKKRQLFISQRVNEFSTINSVPAVRARCYLMVGYCCRPDHEQAREESK